MLSTFNERRLPNAKSSAVMKAAMRACTTKINRLIFNGLDPDSLTLYRQTSRNGTKPFLNIRKQT